MSFKNNILEIYYPAVFILFFVTSRKYFNL